MYPVGSCYFSTVNTSPATIVGGTWAAMTGGMLGLAGSTGVANSASDGGSRKISISQMPSHSHAALNDEDSSHTYYFNTSLSLGTDAIGRANVKRGTASSDTYYAILANRNASDSIGTNDLGGSRYTATTGGVRIIFPHTPLFMVGDERLSKVGEC